MSSIPPPGWLPPAHAARATVPAGVIPSPAVHLPAPATQVRADIWPRVAAFLADELLAGLLAGLMVGFVFGAAAGLGVQLLAYIGTWALVRVAGPSVLGESPGKRLMHLRTVDVRTSEPLPMGRLVTREVLLWLVYWIPLVAFIDAAKTERRSDRLSWRDRKAGTAVVRARPVGTVRVAAVLVVVAAAIVLFVLSAPPNRGSTAQRWNTLRAQTISNCVNRGAAPSACECVVDEAARDVGPAAMLAGGSVAEAAVVRAGETCRRSAGAA